jgi:hypothetical protein
MADVPSASGVGASAAQAGYQAREAAKAKDAAGAERANAKDRQVKALDDASSTVETEDGDTQVYTDSEGSGSQGRSFEEQGAGEQGAADEGESNGVTRDDDGQLHLDIEV